MHQIVESGLEDYFEGRSTRDFNAHLIQCTNCREQVAAFKQVSGLLSGFRSEADPSPSLGFQSRVLRGVREQENQTFWSMFRLDPGFARKLAFGSLLGLALLGGYLVTDPSDTMADADHTPEAVMASHDASSADPQVHQNGMLVTLATYHQ